MKIIGLAGRKRSGKSTIAEYLQETMHTEVFAFADPIRWACDAIFSALIAPKFWDKLEREEVIPAIGMSRRQVEQTLGTQWGRDRIHRDLWLIILQHRMQKVLRDCPRTKLVVIEDIRYENEATFVRAMGGTVIHVLRPSIMSGLPADQHESEKGINWKCAEGDKILLNDGSIEELLSKIDAMLNTIAEVKAQ